MAKSCIFALVMTREELILDCRYYNGEIEPPEGTDSLMWGYEEAWVRMVLEDSPIPKGCVKYYTESYDLPNLLPVENDGTPLGIKAILWSRYDHWCGPGTADSFKRWYFGHYVKDTKTHRQLLNQ